MMTSKEMKIIEWRYTATQLLPNEEVRFYAGQQPYI
jgi:hypothetical protein